MTDLMDNVYNAKLDKDQAKLKPWRSAGLILTYRCNCQCEFCYYTCGPSKGGLMPVDMAIEAWRSLNRLAGGPAKVHLTGGEPFLDWDHLVAVMEAAQRAGLGPVDMVETNGFWAVDEAVVAERLGVMDRLGLKTLKISCDPFHQRFVDIEPVRRLARLAADQLGPDRVKVRWEAYLDRPVAMTNLHDQELLDHYVRTAEEFPCRFNGRAAGRLADRLSRLTIEQLTPLNCTKTFLDAKGVHIDPYGNVFSSTCSGIIVGNVLTHDLETLWRMFHPFQYPIVSTLVRHGPCGLLTAARDQGYQCRHTYAGKCHLCSHIRQFFVYQGICDQVLGPTACYQELFGMGESEKE